MESEQRSALTMRIIERMNELGISQAEVARRGRFNRAFLSDLLRGRKQSIHPSNYTPLAKALLTTPLYLRTGTKPSSEELTALEDEWTFSGVQPAPEPEPDPDPDPEGPEIPEEDLDALNTAFDDLAFRPSRRTKQRKTVPAFRSGGRHDGAALLTDPAIDQMPVPPEGLLAKLYAVAVSDGTMSPRYEPGDFVYAQLEGTRTWPLSVRPKDYVVVRAQGRSGKEYVTVAFVRQLLRVTDDEVVVRQFNPNIETRLPRSSVFGIDRIILAGDAFGDTSI